MMFYGFLLVQFGAIDFIWKGLAVGQRFPHVPLGPLYPIFTFFQEIVMLVILIAVVWGFYRRYVEKLVRLKRNFMAGLALIFIGGLMVAVLFGNGFFLVYENHSTLENRLLQASRSYSVGCRNRLRLDYSFSSGGHTYCSYLASWFTSRKVNMHT